MLENRLEIDVGNTFCKWRVMRWACVVARGQLPTNELLNTQLAAILVCISTTKVVGKKIGKEFGGEYNNLEILPCVKSNSNSHTSLNLNPPILLADIAIDEALVCSVANAECNEHLENQITSVWGLRPKFFKTQAQASGLTNSYSDPSKMGADRWLASIAAKHLYPNQALCIADCGSAINVEFLSAKAEHLGGYIIPGLMLMRQSLLQNTARVTQTKLEADLTLGKNTASNVANGSLFTAVALLEKLQRQMLACSGLLIITGGDAKLLAKHVQQPNVICRTDLVLDGFEFV
ncbi:MAG: type III pantothenate kinase [Oceanospirillaceae bacterium]